VNPVEGHYQAGSLTGAVASIWGALAATSGANLAVCWEVRSNASSASLLPDECGRMENLALPDTGENAASADNQQGSLGFCVTEDPSTTARQTSHWDDDTV
jgi:hypothetical protein